MALVERGARQIRLRRRELVAAGRAHPGRGMNDRLAVRARLDRSCGFALVVLLPLPPVDAVDRSVPLDVAGEVEHEAVVLAVGETGAAADHLHVEADRLGRPQHGDQIDAGRVEAGGQHVGVGETADVAAFEGGDHPVAFGRRGLAEDRLAAKATALDRVADVLGVADAGAEHQPRAAVGTVADDLVDGGLGHRLDVDRRLELAGDELAAAAADAAGVQLRLGPLRHDLAEVALGDHLGDAGLVGDIGEQRAVALVQHAAVEPVGRRGEADHLEVRVDRREIAQEAAVHGVRGARG